MSERAVGEIKTREVDGSREARAEDMRRFWQGFLEFREANQGLEQEARRQLEDMAQKDPVYKDKLDWVLSRGTEPLMLFFYGVKLAGDLQKNLTEKVPVPKFEITRGKTSSFTHVHDYRVKNYDVAQVIETVSTRFLVDFGYLLHPPVH